MNDTISIPKLILWTAVITVTVTFTKEVTKGFAEILGEKVLTATLGPEEEDA